MLADRCLAFEEVQGSERRRARGLCGGVPVWKFGAQWASRNFLRPRKAVLIGDVVAADKKRYAEPFCAARRGLHHPADAERVG
jgi:hypothetical protein